MLVPGRSPQELRSRSGANPFDEFFRTAGYPLIRDPEKRGCRTYTRPVAKAIENHGGSFTGTERRSTAAVGWAHARRAIKRSDELGKGRSPVVEEDSSALLLG